MPESAGLLNTRLVSERYASMIHADSHGASGARLGLGAIYYGMAHAIGSQVSVCIGSGAGFVPGLLRQAQLDAGIDPSVTYLIDANLPDLGFGGPTLPGGWMTENNDFQSWADGVVILQMLSRDASALFARSGLTIDYLHIDGDHSKVGVAADLRDYAPLMSLGGVICLHDYRLSTVRDAISEFMANHPGWERLSFGEIGTGCTFLRRELPAEFGASSPRRSIPSQMLPPEIYDTPPAMDEDPELKAQFERWPYLQSPGFRLRYTIAADFVDAPGVPVVEVGGYPNSIISHLKAADRVYAIEPYLSKAHENWVREQAEGRGARVTFFSGTVGTCALDPSVLGKFNLVVLGFDLSEGVSNETMAAEDLRAMAQLLFHASTTVLEYPGYEPSQIAWDCLVRTMRPKVVHEFVLDLSSDPSAREYLVTDSRAVRRVVVIKGTDPLPPDVVEQEFLKAAQALVAQKPVHTVKESPRYKIGTRILFGKGQVGTRHLRRGWSYPEEGLVWCQGPSSRMEFLFDDPDAMPAGGRLKISLWPAAAAPVRPSQQLAVSVNGTTVFSEALGPGRHQLNIAVPAECLSAASPTVIEFEHPDAIQPCQLYPGKNPDQRSLAFAMEALTIEPE